MKRILILFLPVFLTVGCASTNRHQITVGNEHPSLSLREVRVEADGRFLRKFHHIGPLRQGVLKPGRGAPPEVIEVSWLDAEGTRRHARVEPSDPEFRGQIAIYINLDHSTGLALVAPEEGGLSILPWNMPEAWEGSIMLPGMNER